MQQNNSLFLTGVEFYNAGEYEKALGIFDSFSSESPTYSEVLLHKWNTLGALGRFSEAIDSFSAIINADSSNKMAKKAKEIFETIAHHSESHRNSLWSAPMAAMPKKTMATNMDDVMPKDQSSGWVPIENTPTNILESPETQIFFQKKELKRLNVPKIINNSLTNRYDKDAIINYIQNGDSFGLAWFIRSVILRNTILLYLADSNILPPRKYNTISSQIENINAEFALAFLAFNIGEQKYNEVLIHLWEKPNNITKLNPEKIVEKSEKIGILTVILNFLLSLFSFEKSFSSEDNKLRFFKYLFLFFGFLGMLTLVWYGIKNDLFKVDIKATRTTTASGTVESVTSAGRDL